MQRLISVLALAAAVAAGQPGGTIGGIWTLNRSASDIPKEIGFDAPWLQPQPGSTSDAGGSPGRGGRRGSGGGRGAAPAFSMPRESYEDARRVQFLTGEARNPAARLTIVDAPDALTITNEFGQSRTLHTTGRDETIEVGGVPLVVSAKRDADKTIVTYTIDRDRQVRYTYTPGATLLVDIQFLDHGKGDTAHLVYAAGIATDTPAAAAPSGSAQTSQPAAPSAPGADTRPGAELRGLKSMGILVEELGPQATACGLNHDAIESSLARRLSDAGFSVRRNSDDDTYLYVNIQTSTVGGGTCVSRYDAFLYTHATATLTYRNQPALVQVSLIHRGGIGSSAPAGHAAAVGRALEGYVDVMVGQIRDANQ